MKKKWKQGSFTVEAAMVMGMVLLVIFSTMQVSFTVYDRVMELAQEYEEELKKQKEEPNPVTFIRRAQSVGDLLEEK